MNAIPSWRNARSFRPVLFLFLMLAGGMLAPQTVAAKDYRLGVMDRLRIRVAEWQTAQGTVRDWSVISGEYAIGPSGSLSLPFLGEVSASGKTTNEIAETIGLKMQALFGLRDRPSASVEMAQYRPVYLAGEVENPGEYPYAPNLTVLKAVSLGGGLRRAPAGQRFARDYISAQGDSSVHIAEKSRLLIRRARLQAEIAESDTIKLPKELDGVAEAKRLLDSESALMQSRDRQQKLQLTALQDLRSLLENEIQSLAKKSETQARQLDLVEQDRVKVDTLTERGLAVSSRKLTLEQRVADLQSSVLDIDTASLKAKQDVSRTKQDETKLRNDWDSQLAQELQNTEAELERLELKLGTSRDLMSEALMQSAESALRDERSAGSNIRYAIVRQDDGKTVELPADENAPVLPGDVIKVQVAVATQ